MRVLRCIFAAPMSGGDYLRSINMKKVVVVAMALAALAGCATQSDSGSSYKSSQARGEQTVRMGVVESVRNVTIDKGASGVGTLAGAGLGALGGAAIGGGRGSIATGILGAVAGGVVGNRAEAAVSNKAGLEITVRLDNGTLTAITQDADEVFRPGERVRLLSGSGITRVTH
jgi:outer membrane lipoprotein SlyB